MDLWSRDFISRELARRTPEGNPGGDDNDDDGDHDHDDDGDSQ